MSFPKPVRGSYALDRKATKAQRKQHEQREMQAALVRDHRKCRVPRCTTGLKVDPCHLKHRGMGGNPKGDRTTRATVISLCRLDHGYYDAGRLDIEPQTGQQFDGPCAYYFDGQHVGSERLIGISSERRCV